MATVVPSMLMCMLRHMTLLCMANIISTADGSIHGRETSVLLRTWMAKVVPSILLYMVELRNSRAAYSTPRPVAVSRPLMPCRCSGCTGGIQRRWDTVQQLSHQCSS
jgi:hypothetical protein